MNYQSKIVVAYAIPTMYLIFAHGKGGQNVSLDISNPLPIQHLHHQVLLMTTITHDTGDAVIAKKLVDE